MKKTTWAAIGLLLAMLLSACGSGNVAEAPDPSSSMKITDEGARPSEATVEETEEPTDGESEPEPSSSESGNQPTNSGSGSNTSDGKLTTGGSSSSKPSTGGSGGNSSSKPSTGSNGGSTSNGGASGGSSSKPVATATPTPKPTVAPTPKPTPKPTPAPTPKPTPTPQKSIWQWPISKSDRDAIYAELVAYGQSLGLRHLAVDDGVVKTPDNSSWAAPTTITQSSNPNFVQIGLKNDIKYLPQMVEDYGGGKIDYFIVYVEDLGGGNCKIYIMY